MCFNPRSYERSDASSSLLVQTIIMFQSTLLRKERPKWLETSDVWNAVSIHAPTKGATDVVRAKNVDMSGFNPRSYERSDMFPSHTSV